jgi:hypothetical protein
VEGNPAEEPVSEGKDGMGQRDLHVDIVGMYHSSGKVRVHDAERFIGARSFTGILRYGPLVSCKSPGLTVTIMWSIGGGHCIPGSRRDPCHRREGSDPCGEMPS